MKPYLGMMTQYPGISFALLLLCWLLYLFRAAGPRRLGDPAPIRSAAVVEHPRCVARSPEEQLALSRGALVSAKDTTLLSPR